MVNSVRILSNVKDGVAQPFVHLLSKYISFSAGAMEEYEIQWKIISLIKYFCRQIFLNA